MKSELRAQFNYAKRISLEQAVPLNSPLVIYVEPSSYCNLECRFCPQHTGKGQFEKFNMSVDLFKKVLEDIKEFPRKPELMRFCGIGDPLFNKSITDMVQLADASDAVYRTEVISNGLLLTDKMITVFARHLGRIVISVEGLSDEDYRNFTGRNICFKNLVDKVAKFYYSSDRRCVIHVKIHNQAVLTSQRKELFYRVFGDISDEIYIENLVNLWPEQTSNLGLDAGQRFEGTTPMDSKVCPQIFKSLQVNADGRVLPCCVDWKSINVIGDVNKQSMRDIWTGNSLRDLQKKHLCGLRNTFSPCQGCSHNEYSDKDNLDSSAERIMLTMFGDGSVIAPS